MFRAALGVWSSLLQFVDAEKSLCEDVVASRFHTDEYVTVHIIIIIIFVRQGGDCLWELLTLLKTEQNDPLAGFIFSPLKVAVCMGGAVKGVLCKSQENG